MPDVSDEWHGRASGLKTSTAGKGFFSASTAESEFAANDLPIDDHGAHTSMLNFTTTREGYEFLQARLDTHEWWLIPVATLPAGMFVNEVAERFYTGDNELLLDVILVHQPTPGVRHLPLILASKSCMSRAQLELLVGKKLPEGDLVVHASTPLGVLRWLAYTLCFTSQVDVGRRGSKR
jgi:hypothetical protein